MSGKITTAPCGHRGETIIGTFVRCLEGCDRVAGQPGQVARRGEPGHVEMCACAPCQIRRRVVKWVLVDKDGLQYQASWDGLSRNVTWSPLSTAVTMRHYFGVDSEGKKVVTGDIDAKMYPGVYISGALEFFMERADKVALSLVTVTNSAEARRLANQVAKSKFFKRQLQQIRPKLLEHISYRGTIHDVHQVVMSVSGVTSVNVSEIDEHIVHVQFSHHAGCDAVYVYNCIALALKEVLPAGVGAFINRMNT